MTGDEKRAREEADRAMDTSPSNADILGFAAEVYSNTGLDEHAKALMDKVVILNPNYAPYMNWFIGRYYIVIDEHANGISWLEKTDWMDWYWTQAWFAALHCLEDDLVRGRQALDRTLELNPSFADIFWDEWNFWFEGAEALRITDKMVSGLTACGWTVPPGELIDQ